MDEFEIGIGLIAIVAMVSVVFRNSRIPLALILVIVGMLISFIPGMPHIRISSHFVLTIFLPLLLYDASAYASSWQQIRVNLRPIAFLSIGHVLFITVLVACIIHFLLPQMGWPLAFVLGAVISPPDDVAIMAIAEKIRMPATVVNILKGEAMLNDAMALIIFRFALVAALTGTFSLIDSTLTFFMVVGGETLFGIFVGHVIGELRLRVRQPTLQMLISILTPYMAYLPAEKFGGSGVVATVVTGLYIGHYYWERYPPDVRLTARSIWATLSFVVQSILFLLVGLDLHFTFMRNTNLAWPTLLSYSAIIILTVIIGRFIWVFGSEYLNRWWEKNPNKQLPWQFSFIISWAGMRGGISLAAALAVPTLPMVAGIFPKDLLIFLVFSVIVATLLIQGLSLPWLLNKLNIPKEGELEESEEERASLFARLAMTRAVLRWLKDYKTQNLQNEKLLAEIKFRIKEYRIRKLQLRAKLNLRYVNQTQMDILDLNDQINLLQQIIDIERQTLLQFWRDNKIDLTTKNKLELQLDLRAKHLEDVS